MSESPHERESLVSEALQAHAERATYGPEPAATPDQRRKVGILVALLICGAFGLLSGVVAALITLL
ncbi:hypothetical protein [Haloechinothrix sp. LS1_15]|uniref:hypothetical protein n=1 Tax=Haloechinothrix sp. LS1_15 TaxID=2652248 RepID=UPI00294777EB|nr:hypothetical protein [Haloechinothrix sp. LS1_15]MDV6011169.1 hypothetical protein [Haloechinothrix sp. LS1_15]